SEVCSSDLGDRSRSLGMRYIVVSPTYWRSAAGARPSEAREGDRRLQRPVGLQAQKQGSFSREEQPPCCSGSKVRACSPSASASITPRPARGASHLRATLAVVAGSDRQC